MRSFLAGLLLLVAFVTGTAALGAYVANATLLQPAQAGHLVDYALTHPSVRDRILSEVVPGYDDLPTVAKDGIGTVASAGAVRDAARQLRVTDSGRVSLGRLQRQLAGQLDDRGLGSVASQLRAAGPVTIRLPAPYGRYYAQTTTRTDQVALYGTVATAVLVLLALLVSPRRSRTIRTTGLAAILSCGVVALAYYLLPSLIRTVSSDELVNAASGALATQWDTVWHILVPVAVVGLVLAVLSLFGGRRAR